MLGSNEKYFVFSELGFLCEAFLQLVVALHFAGIIFSWHFFFIFILLFFISSSFKRSFMAWHDTAKSGRLISIDTFKCQKDSMKLPRFDAYSSCSVGTWTLLHHRL